MTPGSTSPALIWDSCSYPCPGRGGRGEEEGSSLSPLLCCCCYLRPNSREPHQGLGAPTCPTGSAGCHPLLPALLWESPWQGLRPAPERVCDSAFERRLSSESSPLAVQLVSTPHPTLQMPGSRLWTKCTGAGLTDCGSPAPPPQLIPTILWLALPLNKPKHLPWPLITSSALMNCELKAGHQVSQENSLRC